MGVRIVRQGRPAGHNRCSTLPWPVFKQEGYFLFFPLPVQVFFFLAIPCQESTSGLKVVALHPDRSVDQVGERLA